MNWPSIFLQMNVYLILFYIFYVLVLQNETFFKWNRVYLLSAGILSLGIPLIQSDWIKEIFMAEKLAQVTMMINPVFIHQVTSTQTQISEGTTIAEWVTIAYLAGVLFFLLQFCWKLSRVSHSFRNGKQAQSFFRKIKVSDTLKSADLILKHEQVHAKELHSADVLFFELVAILNWFNPIVYSYKKSIKYIHEFIADEEAAGKNGKEDYVLLLVSNAFGVQKEQLTNNFFNKSFLKKRIIMLHKQKSPKLRILKYGMSVPLLVGMLILSTAMSEKADRVERFVDDIKDYKIKSVSQKLTSEMGITESDLTPSSESVVRGTMNDNEKDFRSILKFIGSNTRYPGIQSGDTKSGIVLVKFEITDGGQIRGVDILQNPGFSMADNVVKTMGKLGTVDKNLKGNYVVQVNFQIMGRETAQGAVTKLPDNYKLLPAVNIIGYEPVSKTAITDTSAIISATSIEKMPEYPGGIKKFMQWVGANYKYPDAAKEAELSGKLIVQFVVEKDGALSNVKIIRDLGFGTAEAAKELLSKSAKWEPGIQNGKPVRVQYVLPIMLQPNKSTKGITITGDDEFFDLPNPPMVILEGKEINRQQMAGISPDSIESITILKDKSATEKYGEKGKNGVVEIMLKTK